MNEKTKSETQVPSIIPGVSPTGESALGVSGLLALVVSAILHFRRKASRDGSEIVKDRTESELFNNMIKDREGVLKERDAARESERTAWNKHNEVSVENARLKTENDYQQREIARLTAAMQQLQVQFDEIKERLQKLAKGATGHTGYDDPQVLDQ